MGRVAKRVDDEVVEILQKRNGRIGDGAEIGEIGGIAETEAEYVEIAMDERNRNDFCAEEFDGAGDFVDGDGGNGADLGLAVENVGVCAAQNFKCFRVGVNGKGRLLPHIEGPNVV